MLSYTLEKGFDVLKKNKVIFMPFIIYGIISILVFLIIAKPIFEFESLYNSYFPSFHTSSASSFDSYFFKKFMDYISLIVIWGILLGIVEVFVNVAGLRTIKDYLSDQTTKISDMRKTLLTKGFTALFGILAASIMFFLPGIIGMLLCFWLLFTMPSLGSFSSSAISTSGIASIMGVVLIALILFLIQAIILLAFGYYILSKKFGKIYLIGIFITIILLILGVAVGFVSPALSLIFFIPFFILFIVLCFALGFIMSIAYYLIKYIIPSAIVLNDNLSATEAIKMSINFVKDNTANFGLLVVVSIIISIIASIPSFLISFANMMHPSFSLFLFAYIFTIALSVLVNPYILSIYALSYAFSLRKEAKEETESVQRSLDLSAGLSNLMVINK